MITKTVCSWICRQEELYLCYLSSLDATLPVIFLSQYTPVVRTICSPLKSGRCLLRAPEPLNPLFGAGVLLWWWCNGI